MSISLAFDDQPEKRHSLQIVNKLSQGKFEIYHAHCESKKTDYALKLFPKNSSGAAQYQKETLMFKLSHKNIIQSFPVATANHRFYTILTELASYGDVFEMIVRGFFDSEALIRTYFHQLTEGIEYMHSKEIAHLDLKLENLMIGNDFTLKIIDFDQAQKTTDKILTSGGTKAFRAPEVIDGSCTNFTAADIYSAGIILFAFKAQSVPFAEKTVQESENKTTTTLEYHKQFMTKNKTFWETKAALKNDENFYSEGFKSLVNGMLELNPEKRFTLDEIKNSEWYNGPILSQERLKAQMRFKWESSKRK